MHSCIQTILGSFLASIALTTTALCANLSAASMEAAASYSASHGGMGTLIKQHGKIAYEGGNVNEAHKIYSGTKAFWVLAALAAQEEGILNLDERVSATIPEWQADARKAGITVRQLISFTSGMEPKFELHGNGFADRDRIAINASIVGGTGSSFIYGPAALQVFAEVFKRKLSAHGQSLTGYLERKVLRPLGLGPQRYLSDGAGNPLIATGFLLSATQWSRMGDLILAHGRPVLSGSELDQCFHGYGPNHAFGIGFWNNRNAGAGGRETDIEDILDQKWSLQDWHGICLCREAPGDTVAAVGSGYQRLYVIPSLDLIAVRLGNFTRFSDAEFLRKLLGK
jgi:CubicO group peptidase (beta-lactamase class C family)